MMTTGCATGGSSWLGALAELDLGTEERLLGDRPIRDHAVLDVGAELAHADDAWGMTLHSSDERVLRVATVDEIMQLTAEEEVPEGLTGDQGIVVEEDPDDPTVAMRLLSGEPGTVTLTLLDPVDGTALDTLQVEVAEPAAAAAIPVGAAWWETVQGLPARTVEGANARYRMSLTDHAGRSLAGAAERVQVLTDCDDVEDRASCEASQLGAGVHDVAGAALPEALVEVVPAHEIVALELREHVADAPDVASEVLVVGIDRAGQPVRALPAVWTLSGHTLQDAPGDLLAYVHDDRAPLSKVTVRYGDLSTTTWVHAGPEDFGIVHSDEALNCSATGSPAAAWLALGGLALMGLRRRSATGSAS